MGVASWGRRRSEGKLASLAGGALSGGGAAAAVIPTNFKYTAGDSLAAWTTSRASTATYYDVNGIVQTAGSGTMRDGHYLGGARHWLLEPSRINSTIQSQDFTQAAWTLALCTVGGSVTAPDNTAAFALGGVIGTNAVNTLIDGSLNVAITTPYTTTASTAQAYSLFAKPGNKSFCIIQSKDNAGAFHTSWFNVTTGATGTKDASHRVFMWPLGNGWYRIEIGLSTSGAGAGTCIFAFGFTDADNSHTLTGDGATVNGYVWGAQYELDQFTPTSYIPTTTVTVTRVVDVATKAHGSTPQPRALYIKGTNLIVQGNASSNAAMDFLAIGGPATANDQYIRFGNTVGIRAQMDNLSGFLAAGPAFAATGNAGNVIEFRAASATDTSITGGLSVNGGAETTASSATGNAFQAGYTNANYVLLATTSALFGPIAIQQWKDVPGSAISMATCRLA